MSTTGLPKIETRAQFAARLGVNRSTITRAVQAGRLVIHESGNILVEPSLQRWRETKGSRDDVAARHAEKRGADIPALGHGEKAATARNASATQGETEEGNSRTTYKAAVLKYENETIKLEMALRRGMRYTIDDIKREALGLGGNLRASIERLIDQTAPRLAVMADPAARRDLLAAECAAMRRTLRAEFVRAMRRLKRKAGGQS